MVLISDGNLEIGAHVGKIHVNITLRNLDFMGKIDHASLKAQLLI